MCYTSVVGDHCKSLDTFLGMLCISDPHMLLGGAPLGVVLCDPHIYLGGAHVGGPTGSAGLPQPGAPPMQGLARRTRPWTSHSPCSWPCRPWSQRQVFGSLFFPFHTSEEAGPHEVGSHNMSECRAKSKRLAQHASIWMFEGSLETKVPTIWTNEKQHSQEEAEPGRNSDV